MVGLARLMEQGVPLVEIRERAKDDVRLEQELIYWELKPHEPVNDYLPHQHMFPGHQEYRRQHRKSYHHGSARTTHSLRDRSGAWSRTFRPWRDLSQSWPEHRAVVEVLIRGSNASSGRIPRAYHINKTWYDAETGRPIRSIVERWRVISDNNA